MVCIYIFNSEYLFIFTLILFFKLQIMKIKQITRSKNEIWNMIYKDFMQDFPHKSMQLGY